MKGGNRKKVGDVVLEWCAKYPEVPDLTLARMIHAKNKALGTVDSIRSSVRWHRGSPMSKKVGNDGNKSKVAPNPVKSTAKVSKVAFAYRAPKSHAEPHEDFIIHGAQRILRLSDIHYPFHDERALEAAINYGMKKDPTILLLDGDVVDCHDLSAYERDPRKRYTEIELKMVAGEFEQFRSAFPKARIIYKYGNHDLRLDKYLMRRAPELFGLPGLDLPGLISMAGGPESIRGIEWVGEDRAIRAGHLAFLHGHEFRGGGGGINPARWLFLRTGESAICGHFHRISEHSETTLSRKQVGTWSTGCLSELTPAYMKHNKWQHGAAFIEVERDGTFHVDNFRIIDGKIIGR